MGEHFESGDNGAKASEPSGLNINDVMTPQDKSFTRNAVNFGTSALTTAGCLVAALAAAPESLGVTLGGVVLCPLAGMKTADYVDKKIWGK